MAISGCDPGFFEPVSQDPCQNDHQCLFISAFHSVALTRQAATTNEEGGSVSYEGSKMRLPDLSFSKTVYQSSWQE